MEDQSLEIDLGAIDLSNLEFELAFEIEDALNEKLTRLYYLCQQSRPEY